MSTLEHGIKVNGEKINNIRYSDDTVLIAESDVGLQSSVNALNAICLEMLRYKNQCFKNKNNDLQQESQHSHTY